MRDHGYVSTKIPRLKYQEQRAKVKYNSKCKNPSPFCTLIVAFLLCRFAPCSVYYFGFRVSFFRDCHAPFDSKHLTRLAMTASSYQLSAISLQLHTDCFFIFALSFCPLIFEFSPSPGLPRLRLAMTDKKAGNDTLQGNPKLKALNPKQIPISKFKAQNRFSHLDFGHLILFRISDLGFRISLSCYQLSAFSHWLAADC